MRYDYAVLDCDVLVVGSGSAGSLSSTRAKEVDPHQKNRYRIYLAENGLLRDLD